MSYKRLFLLLISQFFIFLLICFLGYNAYIYRESSLAISFLFVTAYFIYTLSSCIKELLKIKEDKEEGPCEEVLIFCKYTVLYKGIERDNNIPPIPIATFKSIDENKYISLTGDYSNISLTEGRKYKVKYYKSSEILVSITSYNINN